MRYVVLVLLITTGLFTIVAASNWPSLATPGELSLLFVTVEAPLGLVMLGFTTLIVVMFIVLLLVGQTNALIESRRSARELLAQRDLADKAEASRFTELRSFLDGRMSELEVRVRNSEAALKQEFNDSVNTLAASIGEIEDRLENTGALRIPHTGER